MSFDEALEVAERLAYRAPLSPCSDWPARSARAFPGSLVPTIVADETGALQVRELAWGFPVPWKKGLVFNTRLETAVGPRSGMWAQPIERGRCLVPAFGFVETHASETVPSARTGRAVRARYRFGLAGGEPMLLAGVCGAPEASGIGARAADEGGLRNAGAKADVQSVKGKASAGISRCDEGAVAGVLRLSLVTTEPNAQVAAVHNRMPLVLEDSEALAWLGEKFARLADRSHVAFDVEALPAEGEKGRGGRAQGEHLRGSQRSSVEGSEDMWLQRSFGDDASSGSAGPTQLTLF